MDREAKVHNCDRCEYIRMYDYGKKIYYCDHPDRIDDMGKIGVDDLPAINPVWCPLSNINNLVVVENSKRNSFTLEKMIQPKIWLN